MPQIWQDSLGWASAIFTIDEGGRVPRLFTISQPAGHTNWGVQQVCLKSKRRISASMGGSFCSTRVVLASFWEKTHIGGPLHPRDSKHNGLIAGLKGLGAGDHHRATDRGGAERMYPNGPLTWGKRNCCGPSSCICCDGIEVITCGDNWPYQPVGRWECQIVVQLMEIKREKLWWLMFFDGIPVGGNEASLFGDFLAAHDLADHFRARSPRTQKFARLFTTANEERFSIGRVTTRTSRTSETICGEIVVKRWRHQIAIWSHSPFLLCMANRARNISVPIRPSWWRVEADGVGSKGLDPEQYESFAWDWIEGDIRAAAIFSLTLYTGCRVGDSGRSWTQRSDDWWA